MSGSRYCVRMGVISIAPELKKHSMAIALFVSAVMGGRVVADHVDSSFSIYPCLR